MNVKKKIIIALALLVAVAAVYKLRKAADFRYAGTVEATEIDVPARVQAVISEYKADEGDSVQKDAPLALLDCQDLRLAADIADKDFARASELVKAGSMSKENYDRAKYRRDDAALKVQWCEIKSPVSGKMLYRQREAGEMVSPGTKIATVADLREVYSWIYVEHDKIANLSIGREVKGYLPETGQEFTGKIAVINDEAEFTPKNVQTRTERTRLVFGVKINFANPDIKLKPGMTVEVKL